MPPKKDTFGTAQQWLKRAKGNLALAKQPKPKEAFWDALCFDANRRLDTIVRDIAALLTRTQNRRSRK